MHRAPRLKPGLGRHCAEAQRAKRLATSGCPKAVQCRAHALAWNTTASRTTPSTTLAAHQIYIHLAWTTRDRQPMIDRVQSTPAIHEDMLLMAVRVESLKFGQHELTMITHFGIT